MVTAELAVAIPVLTLVLAMALGAIRAGIDHVRCVDAARVGARLAARGEEPSRVRAVATAAAPSGATVTVEAGPRRVRVVVSARAGGGVLQGWTLEASAAADVEQGEVGPSDGAARADPVTGPDAGRGSSSVGGGARRVH